MGKKEIEQEYVVQLVVDKSWLMSRGSEIVLRKLWKPYTLGLVVVLVVGVLVSNLWFSEFDQLVRYAMIAVVIGLFCSFYVLLIRGGKRYWDSIKDKEEPIEIEPMPNWWINKRKVDNVKGIPLE